MKENIPYMDPYGLSLMGGCILKQSTSFGMEQKTPPKGPIQNPPVLSTVEWDQCLVARLRIQVTPFQFPRVASNETY